MRSSTQGSTNSLTSCTPRDIRREARASSSRTAASCRRAGAAAGRVADPCQHVFHAEEVERLLAKQHVKAVIVDPAFVDRVFDFPGTVLVRGEDYESALAPMPDSEPPRGDEDAPLVIHTSGTTGHPKGAERRLETSDPSSVVGFCARVPIAPGDCIVVPAPLYHALGFFGTGVALAVGGTQVLMERFDPQDFVSLASAHAAAGAALVPVMLKRILDLDPAVLARHDLGCLRYVVVSGSALPPALVDRARQVFGPTLLNLYGSTEAGWVSIATDADMAAHPGTVGRPLPGVGVRITREDGGIAGAGEDGEIVVESGTMFSGYTEDATLGSVAAPAHLYEMGDLGRMDADGYLYVADRKDDMVVTGGENVYPAEVERVLEQAPGVVDVAVVGVPDEEYGHILVAFAVTDAVVPHVPTAEGLKAFCREHLANYKVPKAVWFIDALPYTGSGKVLRRVLRQEATRRTTASPT
ncbi:MAG: AMP-binding protein [Acidimicrobiia bacterium]